MVSLEGTFSSMSTKTNSPIQTGIKIAIIIVIIIVLLLVSFAMIRLIPNIFSSVSNFKDTLSFFGSKEKITLNVNKKAIMSEDTFVLSWKQQRGNGEGEHIFNFPCEDLDENTRLQLTEADGDSLDVFCEEDISLGKAGESDYRKITFTGFSEAEEDQNLKLSVSHISATSTTYASSTIPLTIKKSTINVSGVNKEKIKEDEDIKIQDEENTKDEAKVSTSTTKTTIIKPSPIIKASPADLGAVFSKSEIRSNNDGVVEFQVINYGQTASGLWRFRATLPQNKDTVIYNSPYQSSIPGGKASIMTLRFESANAGTVQVIVDYYNEVLESNNNNNTATVQIR